MNIKKTGNVLLSCLSIALASCSNTSNKPMSWIVFSPDESLQVEVSFARGSLTYSVTKNGHDVVQKSNLGLVTNEINFNKLSFVETKENNNVTLNYRNISGKTSEVNTSYNETILSFKQDDTSFDVVLRLFNDGYGFRYNINSDNRQTLTYVDESSEYCLPKNSIAYHMPFKENHDYATLPDQSSPDYEEQKQEPYYSYEGVYKKKNIKNFTNVTCAYPLLYSTTDSIYSLLNEAELIGSDYHGSMLLANEGKLKIMHSRACGQNPEMEINLPFASPWRVASVGTLSEVVESNIYENILGNVEYWKPDNYESLSDEDKEIYNYDWVEPGTGLWSVLMYGGKYTNPFDYQADYEFQDHLVDVVEHMGWKWIVLDADWYFGENHKSSIERNNRQCPCEFSEERFKQFAQRTHEKGIKIFVWAHIFQSFYPESKMLSELDYYKDLGIDGVKIDFWDGLYDYKNSKDSKMESKKMVSYYEKFYQECAKRKMVVDCHGCNKPTGERRIYPNVISREAIYGSENKSTITSENSVLLSLTRCVTGPSDFTPATKPLVQNTVTTAHNMAICVTMESGVQCLSAWDYEMYSQETLELTDAGNFYKNIPSKWDETKLLSADLDNNVIYARRSGDKWYIGGLNVKEGIYSVDLSFLMSDNYTCNVYKDTNDDKISREVIDVTNETTMQIDCKANGGFVMTIDKK